MLSDLEICKRIAEIECKDVRLSIDKKSWLDPSQPLDVNSHSRVFGGYKAYNPLTDDALITKFIKKYRISIMFFEEWQRQGAEHDVIAHIEIGNGIWAAASVYFRDGDESLNKAICLAIIEAHKD